MGRCAGAVPGRAPSPVRHGGQSIHEQSRVRGVPQQFLEQLVGDLARSCLREPSREQAIPQGLKGQFKSPPLAAGQGWRLRASWRPCGRRIGLGCLRVAMIAAERDQKAARRQGIAEIRTTQQG
jgi:hypothetical protein